MQPSGQESFRIGDLQWLCFFLTGRRLEHVIDTTSSHEFPTPYFSTWIIAWSRRVVISRALATVRDELAASACKTKLCRVRESDPTPVSSAPDGETTAAELESILLSIDIFPRAVLLLSVFEGVANDDLTVLLDAGHDLVKKARRIGLDELSGALSRNRDRVAVAGPAPAGQDGTRHA